MLTIAILFLITGGLIPHFVEMRILLEDQKRSMHAAETAYQAALENNRFYTISGLHQKDGVNYVWVGEEDGICVFYHSHKQIEQRVCVEK